MKFKRNYSAEYARIKSELKAAVKQVIDRFNSRQFTKDETKKLIFELEQVAMKARKEIWESREAEIDRHEEALQAKLLGAGGMKATEFRDLYSKFSQLSKEDLIKEYNRSIRHGDQDAQRVAASVGVEKVVPEIHRDYAERVPEFGLAIKEYHDFKENYRKNNKGRLLMTYHAGEFHIAKAPTVKFYSVPDGHIYDKKQQGLAQYFTERAVMQESGQSEEATAKAARNQVAAEGEKSGQSKVAREGGSDG